LIFGLLFLEEEENNIKFTPPPPQKIKIINENID